MRKAELEVKFVKLLERLQPAASFMSLFVAIVRDVWSERQRESVALRQRAESRMARP